MAQQMCTTFLTAMGELTEQQIEKLQPNKENIKNENQEKLIE